MPRYVVIEEHKYDLEKARNVLRGGHQKTGPGKEISAIYLTKHNTVIVETYSIWEKPGGGIVGVDYYIATDSDIALLARDYRIPELIDLVPEAESD